MFVTLYLGILHHREKQAGLSTAHNGGITHHLPATSPEARIKNIHMNKLSSTNEPFYNLKVECLMKDCNACSEFFHKTSLTAVCMESSISGNLLRSPFRE